MTILLDTNVALDILLNRKPWYANAALIYGMARQNLIKGYVSASTITDLFYITAKENGKSTAREAIRRLLKVFYPAAVTGKNIYHALELEWDDFEDSVQFTVGLDLPVDYIVTRDTQDFTSSSISAVTPEQFILAVTDRAGDN
jgi:predicted nucleic acid-binding protein